MAMKMGYSRIFSDVEMRFLACTSHKMPMSSIPIDVEMLLKMSENVDCMATLIKIIEATKCDMEQIRGALDSLGPIL